MIMEFQEYRLKQICEIKSGKRIPKGMDFATSITDHPYIRARDIKNGKIQKAFFALQEGQILVLQDI